MVDYYWLKSFTEIVQLFISIFFIIYLKVKYKRLSTALMWLSVFFCIKLLTDLYGILNYTSWISSILTRPVLDIYRLSMGTFEVGMLTSFILFVWSAYKKEMSIRAGAPYFVIALSLLPINWILKFYFQSSLLEVFDLVKLLWIGAMILLIYHYITEKSLRFFAYSILFWNLLWLSEVVLHQHLHLMSEATSWIVFVLAELILTIGMVSYLINIIAQPKIVKFESLTNNLPLIIQKLIEQGLEKALVKEKVYLDADLTSAKLADKLGVTSNDLALYHNRLLDQNFNQLINSYRIEESKKLLADPSNKKMTIVQVMYESGFNSKSVFNTAFKSATGLTPSAYRKLK